MVGFGQTQQRETLIQDKKARSSVVVTVASCLFLLTPALKKLEAMNTRHLAGVFFCLSFAAAAHAQWSIPRPVDYLGEVDFSSIFDVELSPNGRELYYTQSPTDDDSSIWFAERATLDDNFANGSVAPAIVNGISNHWVHGPSLSADGLSLYFAGNDHVTPDGGDQLYVVSRESLEAEWTSRTKLPPTVNSQSFHESGAEISESGMELFFDRWPRSGSGDRDMWSTSREGSDAEWDAAEPFPFNDTTAEDGQPALSPDGLMLVFTSNRVGGFGDFDLWMVERTSLAADWGPPTNLGPTINTVGDEFAPEFFDGHLLFISDGAPLQSQFVPEPSTLGPMGISVAGLLALRRKRNRLLGRRVSRH